MRFKSRGVLALVAVFAMSAVTAAAASATTPEFKPVPTKKKFTATSGKVQAYYDGGGLILECAKSSTTGEITGAHTLGKIVIVHTGCLLPKTPKENDCPVNSVGAKSGEIVTDALKGELGTVASGEAASGVGLMLEAESEKNPEWFVLAKSACLLESYAYGTPVAEVTVVGKKQAKDNLSFTGTASGPKIKTIKLDSGTLGESEFELAIYSGDLIANDELTFEEPVEVT
jgi:hypothetical protein